ncbi:hypothetical protein [Saccharothrix sp.]|uniref:hypothetical protein n=1 Tax=Saccharothrix sp. TaxID=1873460 RepID=UPI002812254A|nr:hypothetical protein [Saccharothrix sp.]
MKRARAQLTRARLPHHPHSARQTGKLVIPVRPTTKALHPHLSMDDFLARRRPDGLSEDHWLRARDLEPNVRVGHDLGSGA